MVIESGNFLKVSAHFQNTNYLLFSVLLLRIHLESISNRKAEITFMRYYRQFNQNSKYYNQLTNVYYENKESYKQKGI